jgi:futalosine hydrolase
MNILLVSATLAEIEPLISNFKLSEDVNKLNQHQLKYLISGVGMTATAYALGKEFAGYNYDLVINVGIAGAFDRSLSQGDVVEVKLDCFAELGAEDGESFLSIDEIGLGKSSIKPKHPFESTFTRSLKKVNSITVNKVHGNDESIYNTSVRLNPQIETMEGAAFFFACNEAGFTCLQIRAISNLVERRNRASWDIPTAIQNLNAAIIGLLNNLQ